MKLLNLTILLLIFLFPSFNGHAASPIRDLKLPPGFKIDIFAKGLRRPRFFARSPDDVIFVTLLGNGKVAALPDQNDDGKADKKIIYLSGLNKPHGITFHDGYLYIGESHQIIRVKYEGYDKPPGLKEVVVPNLPRGGHFSRTVRFGPDGKMYVSIGSSCNVCLEADKRRAAIVRYNYDGSGEELFATGLRNSVGIAFHPQTGVLWGTNNGRDWQGDDLPPDEINIIIKGKHYGWPFCYSHMIPDPDFGKLNFCKTTESPAFEIQAHSAPLGMAFYTGDMFPNDYKGDLFVAFHGSWNRTIPTGYKVVRIKIQNNKPVGIEDFVSGWLRGTKASSTPVDVHIGSKGEMYISDDKNGYIFIVKYKNKCEE